MAPSVDKAKGHGNPKSLCAVHLGGLAEEDSAQEQATPATGWTQTLWQENREVQSPKKETP